MSASLFVQLCYGSAANVISPPLRVASTVYSPRPHLDDPPVLPAGSDFSTLALPTAKKSILLTLVFFFTTSSGLMQHKKRQVDPCHALHNMKESLNPLSRGEPSNPNNDSADTNTVIGFGSSLWIESLFLSSYPFGRKSMP